MGGMMLLDRARAAGLSIAIKGDRLVVRGPRRAEPIVRELMDRKAEILGLLVEVPEPAPPSATPDPANLDPTNWAEALRAKESRQSVVFLQGGYRRLRGPYPTPQGWA